jgi:hypothetical protein
VAAAAAAQRPWFKGLQTKLGCDVALLLAGLRYVIGVCCVSTVPGGPPSIQHPARKAFASLLGCHAAALDLEQYRYLMLLIKLMARTTCWRLTTVRLSLHADSLKLRRTLLPGTATVSISHSMHGCKAHWLHPATQHQQVVLSCSELLWLVWTSKKALQ